MPAITYPHIEIRDGGVPWISDTATKVIEIILDYLAYHWDAREIQRQHPHLTLGQIYSALGYYHDNQAEMDAMIDDRERREEEIFRKLGDSPVRAKVLAAKAARSKG